MLDICNCNARNDFQLEKLYLHDKLYSYPHKANLYLQPYAFEYQKLYQLANRKLKIVNIHRTNTQIQTQTQIQTHQKCTVYSCW